MLWTEPYVSRKARRKNNGNFEKRKKFLLRSLCREGNNFANWLFLFARKRKLESEGKKN